MRWSKAFLTLLLLVSLPMMADQLSAKEIPNNLHQSFAKVEGTVTDGDGQALVGVSIRIKDTQLGTISQDGGKFSLNVPEGKSVLIFSYYGFKTLEEDIAGRNVVNVSLESETTSLDEVVVVGYGTQKKSDLTGSVSSIKGDEIRSLIAGNPTSALQGKLAGIQIENNGGQPGGAANVFVRGVSSLTNSFPLYVIDGTFAENMNFLNPKDIERIEVLKDASAAAIYGSRAANGVVIITTKRGAYDSKPTVSLDMRIGVETPSRTLDFLDGPGFVAYRQQREENDATGFTIDPAVATYNTDWQDLSLNQGLVQDYGLSVSGGGKDSRYYISGNYFNQDGILVSTGFERYNLRANSEFKLGKLKIQESIGITQGEIERNNWFGRDGSTAPILRENAPENEGGFEAPDFSTHGFGGQNKYALAVLEDNMQTDLNLYGNINLSYEIIKGLTAKLNTGAEYINSHIYAFRPTYFMSNSDAVDNVNDQNDLTDIRSTNLLTLIEPTLSYGGDFGSASRIDAVVGFTQQRIQFRSVGVYLQNLPNNDIQVVGAGNPADVQALLGQDNVSALRSYFGRVNLNLANKYLFSGTIRRDASSKFAPDFRVGYFPSVSVGWKISNEDFWNFDNINLFKIRAGYGTLGSQNIPDYSYQSVFNLTSSTSVNNEVVQGYAQTSLALEDIKWETAITTNVGFDIGLWNNKLNFSIEYYNKSVRDVLVGVNLPSSVGFSQPVIQNVGEINNSGIELEGVWRNLETDFKWNLGFNFSTFNSQIVSLPNPVVGPSVSEDLVRVNRFIEGEAPGVYWGFIIDGVYPTQEAINSDPNLANDPERRGAIQPGDFIRRDLDGDGMITGEDQTILGDPTPDFIYGLNFTGSYKGLDFGIFFQGVQGNEIYNVAKYYNLFWADDNKITDIQRAWTPTNTNTDIPRTTTLDNANNGAPSSFFVEDGSYFRLRTLEIGYTMNMNTVAWMSDLRVFLTGQNLWTLTGYSGYSPDISSVNGGRSAATPFFGVPSNVNPLLGRGLDVRAYPNTSSLIFGVQANF
ncbi:MAG: TonB-dependent receptor [Bacteroidia bacterium]|nr:TonB-dependent receptor [Bacteroidia bacterium]